MSLGTPGSRRRSRALAAIVAGGLFFVACGGGDDGGGSTETAAPEVTEAPATSDAPGTSDAPVTEDGPPTGPEMLVGMVNTEGNPNGLDFPDLRRFAEAAFEYMNAHGGFGGRPVKLETCVAGGTPETSQKCAQELVGKGVELVLLGLDLFPDYATYGAANIPVIGVLPILPPDNTAEALFLTENASSSAISIGVPLIRGLSWHSTVPSITLLNNSTSDHAGIERKPPETDRRPVGMRRGRRKLRRI